MAELDPRERVIIRELAERVAAIAAADAMRERIRLWKLHNSLRPERPMILVFPEGSWGELLPHTVLQCTDERLRGIEWELRRRIYEFEHFAGDNVVTGDWVVHRAICSTGWGLDAQHKPSSTPRGAWAFDPVIVTPADMDKLHWPELSVDDDATERHRAWCEELFGDLLEVKVRGVTHVSFHLMNLWTGWHGLEQTLFDMAVDPAFVHAGMEFLTEGHLHLLAQYEALNLYSLNNDNTYHNSGGNSWTDELPADGFDPARVRPADMWASAESQELSEVSPAMHLEFALNYERRLLEPFALTGYGCCDQLHHKLDEVFSIPTMRRISASPFADVDKFAAGIGNRAIFSWKPQPSHLVGRFDPERIRRYIQHTLDAARAHGCVLEMILKDTHTCEQCPERFDRWTQIARELVEREAA